VKYRSCGNPSFRVFSLFWNVASARDEISLRQWSAQLRTLEGVLVAKNAVCWQQCFFFAHAVFHMFYTRLAGSMSPAKVFRAARDAFWEFSNN